MMSKVSRLLIDEIKSTKNTLNKDANTPKVKSKTTVAQEAKTKVELESAGELPQTGETERKDLNFGGALLVMVAGLLGLVTTKTKKDDKD